MDDDYEDMYAEELTYDIVFIKYKDLSTLDRNRIECIASYNNISPLRIESLLIYFNDFIESWSDNDLEFILLQDDYKLIFTLLERIIKSIKPESKSSLGIIFSEMRRKQKIMDSIKNNIDIFKSKPELIDIINFTNLKFYDRETLLFISEKNLELQMLIIKLLSLYNIQEIKAFFYLLYESPNLRKIILLYITSDRPFIKLTGDKLLYIKNTTKNRINYFDIKPPNNIGIEIEGCIDKKLEESLNFFNIDNDYSIKCPDNEKYINREYILKGFTTFDKIDDLNEDIDKINCYLNNDFGPCEAGTCGIHFHISNENILINLYGLLFLVNLVILWLNKYQDLFIDTFPYQLRLYCSAYNQKNPIEQLAEMEGIKQEIIRLIEDNKFDDIVSIYKLYLGINKFNNKKYFLNVYADEYKYIHIEFRGLATVAEFLNINAIREYLEAIKNMYVRVMDISQQDFSNAYYLFLYEDERKYLKYKLKYLKLKQYLK